MYIQIKQYRLYPLAILLTSLVSSVYSPVYAEEKSYEQTFVVTAYYSPLPGQSAYFRGSYEEDIAFNGKGTNGADGTEVYTGMIAAPDSYPLGAPECQCSLYLSCLRDRSDTALLMQLERRSVEVLDKSCKIFPPKIDETFSFITLRPLFIPHILS